MSKLRVGIVGAGFGGAVHAPAFRCTRASSRSRSRRPSSAERVARERKIPHAFPSVEGCWPATELDVVAVASPPFDHHRSVLAALAAGKHVLCEKPFALERRAGRGDGRRARSAPARSARWRSSSATRPPSSRSRS